MSNYNKSIFASYLQLEQGRIFQDIIRYTLEYNLPELTNKSVYDVGFGMGFSMNIAFEKGASSYLGIDLSDSSIDYLNDLIKTKSLKDKTKFVIGDATDKTLIHKDGPFDLVINVNCMYAYSYLQLVDLCSHMYNNTKKNGGVLFLLTYHLDGVYTKERLKVLEKFNHYLEPVLNEGEQYADFSSVRLVLKETYLDDSFVFDKEPIIGQNHLIKALKVSGYKSIKILDALVRPDSAEKDALLEFQKEFSFTLYVCEA